MNTIDVRDLRAGTMRVMGEPRVVFDAAGELIEYPCEEAEIEGVPCKLWAIRNHASAHSPLASSIVIGRRTVGGPNPEWGIWVWSTRGSRTHRNRLRSPQAFEALVVSVNEQFAKRDFNKLKDLHG